MAYPWEITADGVPGTEDSLEIIPLAADKPRQNGSYSSPFTLALSAPALTISRLCQIGLFPHNADLVFSIIAFQPDLRTWVIGLWELAVGGGNPKNQERIRWALAELILTNSDIAKAFERATTGLNTDSTFQRLLDFVRTISIRWNPHSKHFCAYAKPCTDDYDDWEAVRTAIRKSRLTHATSMVTFEPVAVGNGNAAPWCQNCKNDDHMHWGCFSPKDDDDWWGSEVTGLSAAKEGILAKPWKKNNSRPSGAPSASSRANNPSCNTGGGGQSSGRNSGRNSQRR
ncbi:hypothetical protein R3P38DRAFT_2772254 [Favolaschia claudopus]|uniref:Gag protein n=1 Tax=Favolaschia claudopus TaxID=2862362 RepID=A0AAW0C4H3_9AGAR